MTERKSEGEDNMASDSASADDGEHTSSTASQGPNSDFNLLDNNFENIFVMQVAMLDGALLSLKKTTDHILSEVRGQPTAIGLAVKNPQTGKRIRLDHARFIRLNKWLGSNIDILRQFIWKDEDNSGLRGGELGENEMPGDLNRILSLLCDKGYSEVIKNITESLLASKCELDVIKYLDLIKEEQNRFKLWTSTTGIDEGALSILVKHDLYKQYGEILQSILVDLISLYEDCFTDDESIIRNLIIPVRNQWLGEARRLLVLLPDKSDKTEHYLFSDAAPKSPRPGPLISIGIQDERNSPDLPSGASQRNQNLTGNASRQPYSAPPGQDHGPSTSPQYLSGHSPLQLHKSSDPIGSPTRPASRGSTASTSFSILVDERPLPEYLIDSLKESNKTLITLVRSLEMAKANMGEGSHSKVYQAIRDMKGDNQPQPSSPVEPFQLPPPVEPFQLPLFGKPYISRPPPPEFVKANSHPGTSHFERPEIPLPSSTQPLASVPVPPTWSSPRKTQVPVPPPEKGQQEKTGPPEKAPEKRSMPQKPSSQIAGQNTPLKLGGAKALDESNYPEIYLWGKIKSAALTEDKDLQYLLGQLQDIGFGLYCDRHSLLFSNLGLPKWVALEVLRCMWKDDSQMTRNSFAEKAKNILSGKEEYPALPQSAGNNLIGPATPAPLENYNQPFAIDGKIHGKLYPQALGADTYQSPGDRGWRSSSTQLRHDRDHELSHRSRQNDRGQQLISATAYNSRYEPNYDDSDPYRYSSRFEPPTRAGTFEIPASTSRNYYDHPGSPLVFPVAVASSSSARNRPRSHYYEVPGSPPVFPATVVSSSSIRNRPRSQYYYDDNDHISLAPSHIHPYNYNNNNPIISTQNQPHTHTTLYGMPGPAPAPAPATATAPAPPPPPPPAPAPYTAHIFPPPKIGTRRSEYDNGYYEPSRVGFGLRGQDSNSINNPFPAPHRHEHPRDMGGEAKDTKKDEPLSALSREKSRPRNPRVSATVVDPVLEGLKEETGADDT